MPPKRKKSSFENFLEAHEQDHVQQPSEISFAVLQEAYAQALTPLQPACKREKAERETKQQENNLKDRHNGSFKRVDASDDEVQIVHPGKKGVSSSAGSGSGILACNGKNCEHRAACLNWSGGLEDWGDEHKSFRRYCRRLGLEPDPSTSTRDPNLPVGLKNLGATCYANSYLQVWFQNMAFRHAVYQCSPVASTSQTKIEDTPLFQLQVTFTALQQGPTSVFNPQPLVRSLKLAETEQQDSSEFGKLFLGLLDNQFAKQPEPRLRQVVSDMFAGEMVYGTQCHGCKGKSERGDLFYELEISLKPNCILEERIGTLLETERLDGQNQYFCERCQGLRDATRFTRLSNLPPVLHFSLMRFVYDFDAEERKKTNNFITFPAQLDMSPYVDSSEACIYDLAGVLLHQGASAHFGHYTADVFDTSRRKWYHCDDELVQEISNPFKKRKEANSRKPPTSKSNNGKQRVFRVDDSDEESQNSNLSEQQVIRSKDAYMLVYVRRDSEGPSPQPQSPTQAADFVSSMYETLQAETADWIKRRDEAKVSFDRIRESKEQIWSRWWPPGGKGKTFFVNAGHLKKAMTWELFPRDKTTPQTNSSTPASAPIPDPFKPVPTDPETLAVSDESEKQDQGGLSHASKQQSSKNQAEEGINDCVVSSEPPTKQSPPAIQTRPVFECAEFMCDHGKLKISSIGSVKRVAEGVVSMLAQEGLTSIEAVSSLCRDCVFTALNERSTLARHEDDIATFKSLTSSAHGTSFAAQSRRYWVSRSWLDEWRKAKPNILRSDGSLPGPDCEPWSKDVYCQHKNLQPSITGRKDINQQEYDFLLRRFPSWSTFESSTRKCSTCASKSQSMSDEELSGKATHEKAQLQTLFSDLTRLHKLQPPPGRPNVLIPKDFLRSWKTWIKKPLTSDRPEPMNFVSYRCDHGQTILDPNNETQMKLFTSVSPVEWDHLEAYHPYDGFRISIMLDEEAHLMKLVPPFCQVCQERSLRDFKEATVQLLILSEDDFDDAGCKRPVIEYQPSKESQPPAAMKDGQLNFTAENGLGVRRSGRARNGDKSKNKGRKVQALSVRKGQTLLELKIQINDILKTPTIYQRLWLRDQELTDNEFTVEQMGLFEGALIELLEIDESSESALAKFSANGDRHLHKRRRRDNEGFSSTVLHGYDTPGSASEGPVNEDMTSAPSTPAEATMDLDNYAISDQDQKVCDICTLLNPASAEECEACASPFPTFELPSKV